MSTSWCLDFARTVFTAVFGSESRHRKRSRIWQDGGTQTQARRGKHADNGSGSIYLWEQGKRNKQGERNKTLILAACALGYVEKPKKRCRKHREIYLGTQLDTCWCTHTHTHTHTFYHSWQILGTAYQKGAIKVCWVQSSKRLWPSHQLAATHCASCSLRHQAKIRSLLFHFKVTKGQ